MKKIICILIAYLSGNLLFGQYITKIIAGRDLVKESNDSNLGTANAFMLGGMGCGIATLLCDLLKGFLPVAYFQDMFSDSVLFSFLMIAPVLGHAFPVMHGFRGGKGIAVSFGVLLGVSEDYRALIILIFYYLLFSALRVAPHSRRSIITYLCFTITSCILIVDKYIIYGCMGIAVIVIWKHKKAEMAQVRER